MRPECFCARFDEQWKCGEEHDRLRGVRLVWSAGGKQRVLPAVYSDSSRPFFVLGDKDAHFLSGVGRAALTRVFYDLFLGEGRGEGQSDLPVYVIISNSFSQKYLICQCTIFQGSVS